MEWDAGGGASDREWSNPTNWTGNTEPTILDSAYVNGGFTGVVSQGAERALELYIGSTNKPSHDANSTGRIEQTGGDFVIGTDLFIGKYAGAVGSLLITNGTLTVSNRLMVGDQGLGVLVITNGGAVTAHGDAVIGNSGVNAETPGSRLTVGGGSLTINSALRVSGDNTTNTGSDGRLDQFGGTILANGIMKIGDNDSSTGLVMIAGGSLNVGSDLVVGENIGAIANFNLTGDATVRVSGVSYISRFAGSWGALAISGGLFSADGTMEVGNAVGVTGVVHVSGGNLQGSDYFLGRQGISEFFISGGAVTASTFVLSYAPNGIGQLTVSGGRLVLTNDGAGFVLRRRSAVVSQTGGVIEANGIQVGTLSAHNLIEGPAVLNLSGGTMMGGRENNADVGHDFVAGAGESVTGTVVISGGLLDLSRPNNDLLLGQASNSLGVVVLSGGTVEVGGDIAVGLHDDNGAGRFIISSGVLTNTGSLLIGPTAGGSGYVEVAGASPSIRVGNLAVTSRGELRAAFIDTALAPILVAETITAGGVLSITNSGAFSAGTYLIATSLSGTAVSGTFAATNWLGGVTGTVSYADNRVSVALGIAPAGLGGQVRLDTDGDGDVNDADAGVERVTVILFTDPNGDGNPADGTAVATNKTDAAGSYSFPGRAPGNYVLVSTDRPGYRGSGDSQGANDNRIAVTLSGIASTNNIFLDEYEPLAKTVDKTEANVGETLTYTITPFYHGNGSMINYQVTDAVPTGTAYVAGSASVPGTFTNGVVSWQLGNTANGTAGTTSSNFTGFISPSADTYIDAGSATANFGGNTRLNVNPGSGKGNSVMSSLITFDLSSIPSGASIQSAWLRMEVATAGRSVNVFRATTEWTGGGATWNTRNGSSSWAGGGSFSASDYNSTLLGSIITGTTGVRSNNVLSTVQGWVQGSLTNRGFALLAGNAGDNGTTAFYSNDEGTESRRPALFVRWYMTGTSNRIDIIPNMVGGTSEVKVTMSLSSPTLLTNVVPVLLSTNTTGGVTATLIEGPYPSSANVHTSPVEFVYYYNVASGPSTGSLYFTGGVSTPGGSFNNASSDRIHVFAPLSFQVEVPDLPGVSFVTNRARNVNSGGLPTTNSLTVTTFLYSVISGQVREDADGDGNLADPDVALSNVTVTLFTDPNGDGDPADGAAIATNVTSAVGYYAFSYLITGAYVVVESDPADYFSTSDSEGANNNRVAVNLDVIRHSQSNSFLDTRRAMIAGQVREDVDGDGDFNDADSGIAAVTVVLYTDPNGDGDPVDGVAVATNVTDGSGNYVFPSNTPGAYVIQETDLTGYLSSSDSVGGNDNRIARTLVSGIDSTNNIFLDIRVAAVSGHVRDDVDGLGNLAGAYGGITNVDVVLWSDPNADGNPADGVAMLTNRTDAGGAFSFPSNYPGYYIIVANDPAGYLSSADSVGANDNRIPILLASGSTSNGLVFLDTRLAAISGSVRHDTDGDADFGDADNGITNVAVVLWSDPNADGNPSDGVALATNRTDASGAYIFANRTTGTYVVVETDPAGFVSIADSAGANDNRIPVVLPGGQHSTSNIFLDTMLVWVRGQVRNDTDADGNLADADLGIPNVSIRLYTDPNGDGNPADGSLTATNFTDVGGYFTLTNLFPGRYVLVETDLAGSASTADSQGANDNRIALTLLSGELSTNNVFLDTVLVNISGEVRHDTDGDGSFADTDAGISNVTVTLYTDPNSDGDPADGVVTAVTATASSGAYTFTGISAGNYVIVETDPSGYISTADTEGSNDNRIAVTVLGTVDSTANHFLDTQPVLIGGQVRHDVDSDSNISDPDEGLFGATVYLYTDPNRDGDPADGSIVATNVTLSDGYFSFSNLLAGAYVLVEVDPLSFASTWDSVGFPTDNRIPRILTSGQVSTNNYFLDGTDYDIDLPGVESNLETIAAGSWIIPMDNSKQNIGAVFNLKAYGLVASLLHSNIPVKWVIRAGKTKDEKDFTAHSRRLYPSVQSATNADYLAGPFVIPKIFTNQAAAVIAAYGNNVAVYELLSNTVMDVRYTLNTRPVVAALNDGGTIAIHLSVLQKAGFVESISYYQRYAFNTNPISTNSCYSFASEPHFEIADPSAQAEAIRDFVTSRGNFLAQCVGVLTYENQATHGHFHTSHGIEERDDVTTYTYPGSDLPFNQFQGDISDEGGSLHEWGMASDSTWVNNAHVQVLGVQNTNTMRASHGKMIRGRTGGNIFYLGGHNYDGTTIGDINGQRMYMNAVFVPSLRPEDCGLTFGADIGVTKTDGADYAPAGQTNVYTIIVTNHGPDGVINVLVEDVMPANFSNVTWSAVGAGGAVVPNTSGVGDIAELVDLPDGATVTYYVTGLVAVSDFCVISNAVRISVPENVIDIVETNDVAYDESITHVISIGGHVRDDLDADGDLLDAHPGLTNVTITLYTDPNGDGDPADGAILGTQSTAADGSFLFANVTTGRYIIEQIDLPGYQSVTDSDGTNDNLIVIDVICGVSVDSTNNLFLDTRLATVSGQVRNDADADGNLLDPDAGLAGATVVFYTDPNGDGNPTDGVAIATNITGVSGNFSFSAIDTGRYVIVETDPPGYASSADSQGANDNRIAILLPGGVNSTGHIFLDTAPADIGGSVRHDLDGDANPADADAGIENVTLTLYSDPNGDGNPVDGSPLISTLTDADGRFLFEGIIPAYYVVVETDPAGYVSIADTVGANDNHVPILLVSGISQTNHIFFDAITADIAGQVREDIDGDGDLADPDSGLSNVVVRIFTDPDCDGDPSDGIAVATNVTDATGNYVFTDVIPRCYVVVETDPVGLQSTADRDGGNANQISIALISNSDTNGNDFLDTRIASISGWVLEDQDGDADLNDPDPGINGATLVLYSDPNNDGNPSDGTALATNVTDVSGSYLFGFLNPGSYVIVETDVAGYFSTNDRDGTNDNQIAIYLPGGVNSTNNNFLDARTADISGQVRNDLDGDGDLTDVDPPLTNVTVRLFTDPNRDGDPADGLAILTNLTDGAGNYLFPSVAPGYYVIVETEPAGYQSTADRDGGNLNWIVLGPHRSGVNTNGNDFLDSVRAAIRGQVRNDIDGDGDFNDPDVGIHRVVITLFTDPNGDGDPSDGMAIATNLTDESGYYAFTAMPTGTYVVVEIDPDGYHSTADTDGANDNRIRAILPGGVDAIGNNFLDDPDRVFKAVDHSLAYAGDTLTYSISTFYAGNQSLTNVVLLDTVPSGTVYVAGSANAGGVLSSGAVRWSLGSTAPGVPGIVYSNFSGFVGPSADTYIDAGSANANFGSNNRLNVNPGTGKGNTVMNSLITFDLSSIPSEATIHAAWLRMEVQSSGPNVNIYGTTTDWTQNNATWNTRNGSNNWSGGGSFSASDYSATLLGTFNTGSSGVKSNNVLTSVENWVQGTVSNRGFALISAANANGTTAFYSNEEGTSSRRPALFVNWSVSGTVNELDVVPSLIGGTSAVQVVMTLTSPTLLSNVVPMASLTTNATGGVTATKISGPTPASATVHTNPVSFTYVYNVVAGSTVGTLSFSGGATATGGTFLTATSDRIIVTPTFRYQAQVLTTPGVSYVTNVAVLTETNFIPSTNSNPVVTMLRSAIRGQVREDIDGDGNLADADPGLTNVIVMLYTDPNGDGDPSDGVAVTNTVTDATGYYLFPYINTGRYVVVETDPAGAVSTADSQGANDNRIAVHISMLSISTNNVFLDSYPVSISGQVRNDTDADGDFSDPDAAISNVTVRLFTDPNGDGDPADGVALATNYTDGAGSYAFNIVTAGLYVVVMDSPSGYHPTADRDGGVLGMIALSLTSRVNSVTNDFLVSRLAAIYGSVLEDMDGDHDVNEADPALTNVTVVLYYDPNADGDPSDGFAIATNVTDSSGEFFFGGIDTGDYVLVQTDLNGFVSSADSDPPNDNRIRVNMPGAINSVSNIFLDYVHTDISGQVREDVDGDANFADPDNGLANATIRLYTDPDADGDPSDGTVLLTVVTTGSGLFAFTNLPPGRYVVTETDPDGYASTADTGGANDNRIPLAMNSRDISVSNVFLDARYDGIGITKTPSIVGEVAPGEVITYSISVFNTGRVVHAGVTVQDYLPDLLDYVPGSTRVNLGAMDVRDEFNEAAYSNNDGSLNWAANWIESGESDGPGAGRITATGGSLMLSAANRSISRNADLSEYTQATLRMDYRIESFDGSGDNITLSVSSNGINWITLHQWIGPLALSTGSVSYNVTGYMTTNTSIRLLTSSGMANDDLGYFDNVSIEVVNEIAGQSPPTLIEDYVINTGQTIIITFDAVAEASVSIVNEACVTTAYQTNPFCAYASNDIIQLLLTQGVVAVIEEGEAWQLEWTTGSNPTNRAYDVIYVDTLTPGFHVDLSNQWDLVARVFDKEFQDLGSDNHPSPSNMNEMIRFYRAAYKDRWQTNNTIRNASRQIYVAKAIQLSEGENFVSLFMNPDKCCVSGVFGTNLLPAGSSMSESTIIEWYGATSTGQSTNTIWLDSVTRTWQYSGGGEANLCALPLNEGFNIVLPPGSGSRALPVIGLLPTNVTQQLGTIQTLKGGRRYNVTSCNLPYRIRLGDSGLREAGFRGVSPGQSFNPNNSDEIRIMQRGGGSMASPVVRILMNANSEFTFWTGGSGSAENYRFNVDDAIIIYTRKSTNDLNWTIPLPYPTPTPEMTP